MGAGRLGIRRKALGQRDMGEYGNESGRRANKRSSREHLALGGDMHDGFDYGARPDLG